MAVRSQCARIEFYGGEILLDIDTSVASAGPVVAIRIEDESEFHAYGSAIRARSTEDVPTELIGIQGGDGTNAAYFQMSGGIVNVSIDDGVTEDVDATALSVLSGSSVLTPDVAWVVNAGGSGTPTRIETAGSGVAEAPFLWQSGGVGVEVGVPIFERNGELNGWVTLRGAGRERTVLDHAQGGVHANYCVDLEFMHLTSRGVNYAVRWFRFDLVTGACRGETTAGCESP